MAKIIKHFDFTTPLISNSKLVGEFEISGIGSYYPDRNPTKEQQIEYDIEQIFFTDAKTKVRQEVSVPMLEGLYYGELPEIFTSPTYAHLLKLFILSKKDRDVTTDLQQDLLTDTKAA